ncbi:hypothetical protein HPULCUR_000081 [Helicostylum pulchrum]|uniref:Galactose oxidase n=1 Tax=Helicostylum pulchrum TaxID=562976 RepID=A0ABP9XKK3_9FUNG
MTNVNYQVCFLKLIILTHILHLTVYASNEPHQHGRKHSTAHYFPNGTVYILGGIEYNKASTEIQQLASPITFEFNKQELSLSTSFSNKDSLIIPPTVGHTSHFHVPSNSIISVFGMQQDNKESPPLIPSFHNHQTTTTVVPSGRFRHTSVILNNTLYVIGGADKNSKLIESQDMIWNYSFSTDIWKSIGTTTTGMAGHISLVYKQYIISCFGYQSQHLLNGCTWLDTNTFDSVLISQTTAQHWPSARIYSSLISLVAAADKYVLFGGQVSDNDILDDMWQLEIRKPFEMNWQRIKTKINYKRSGHASALLENENIALYYGGQVGGSQSLATDPIYLDLSKMEWIQTTTPNGSIRLVRNDVDLSDTTENHGLGGGVIAGIIVSIVGVVALSIGFFIWKKRAHRQNNIHQQSRAARFSQSPTPMHSIIQDHNTTTSLQGAPSNGNTLSLPELALSCHSSRSRISAVSLGEQFQFSADSYHRQSHQSTDSAILGQAPPKIECIQEEESATTHPEYKRRESTGFKRLTLNLFSTSQDESKKKDRSSSLFQLRSSKLLLPNTPNTPEGKFPSKGSPLHSRISLGAKSVSSIQWVGFNDNMDYKGNNWRDSSASSMHLAVTNAQRASSHYTSDSGQSTPRSPMFPTHLRDSTAHYQLNETESNSWKANVNKNSGTS